MSPIRFTALGVRFATFIAAWALPCATSTLRGDIALFENGQSPYRIVIAANAIASDRYAAEELQRYFERITGAQLPIVTDGDERTAKEIVLGAASVADDAAGA